MSVTILKCADPLHLAKVWKADGTIEAAARVKWFAAEEFHISTLDDFCLLIQTIEVNPRIALVKETIAPEENPKRLRRTCNITIDDVTGECYPAGLKVVERNWVALDIDGLPRPKEIDWSDGVSQAAYARNLLPDTFKSVACVWQLSGRAGHPSYREEIRMHMFFMCDSFVAPGAWKAALSELPFIDRSLFDPAHLIFTAAPIMKNGPDPISNRHGLLEGEPFVRAPTQVIQRSQEILLGKSVLRSQPITALPMPAAAEQFVTIIAESNVLRSNHPAYDRTRCRRLAFCSMLFRGFGICDEELLSAGFLKACIGPNDPDTQHDLNQALAWAYGPEPDRTFYIWKLLRDASVALHRDGKTELGKIATNLAYFFRNQEPGVRS